MSRLELDKANESLQKMHLRSRMTRLNKKLDEVEVETMKYMKIDSWSAQEFVHHLIDERENIKAHLKDVFDKLYGC